MTKDITGRDGFIIRKALYYAIQFIDSKPESLPEHSDRADMMKLLNALDPEYVEQRRKILRDFIKSCEESGEPINLDDMRYSKVPEKDVD